MNVQEHTAGQRTHECAAERCGVRIGTHLLMCPRHWGMLPAPLRRDVTARWSQVQEGELGAVASYRQVREEAVRVVDRLEQGR